jgi:phosphatidylglycerol---prolipoprotein diacylglyceryl transferase
MILGFALVTLWAGYRAKAEGLDANVCPALALWVIPAALAGAKIFAIVHHLLQGGTIPLELRYLKKIIFGGGLIAYGGVLAGIAAAYAYMKIRKLDFFAYADAYAPALGLGVAVMRLGCFFAGCCWGKGDFTGLTVSFPPYCRAGAYQVYHGYSGLFPSQLLAAADGLAIMGILLWLERRIRIKGALFLAFTALYALARFGEDFTRFYRPSEKMSGLTYNQWVGLLVIVVSAIMLAKLQLRSRERPGTGPRKEG